MTRDDIIKMAIEARLPHYWESGDEIVYIDRVTHFANLVAQHEREACLALRDHEDVLAPIGASAWGEAHQAGWTEGTEAYWKVIKARGTK